MKLSGPRLGFARAFWRLLLVTFCLSALYVRGNASGTDDAARQRIITLREELARHDDLYFRQAKPEISDAAYDRLKRELHALESAHPNLPAGTRSIGDDRSGRFPIHVHRERMLSLDKAYTEAEWRGFHARLVRQLGRDDLAFIVEPKYDGLAISLTYERGVLVRAATRGNGAEGDDVTANARTIGSLPAELRAAGGAVPARVELRGEVYLDHAEFARINAEREATGDQIFTHPRNLAAGTLKNADPAETAQRRLSVVIHGWGAWEGGTRPRSQQEFHAQVRAWGLPVVQPGRIAHSADEAWAAVRALGQERNRLGFPIDGAVVKLDDTNLRERVGAADHAPRWAIACKYEPERAVTRLRTITLQVGRTGVLTPVAEFDPVELGGATVARATLHNRDEIARRDIRIGDFIEVERAGEVIPAVIGVQQDRRPAEARPYVFPDRCPSCAAAVVAKSGEAAVRCPNPRCPAQRQRRLEHFASAQGVDLKGVGPATITALIAAGLLESPAGFYGLRRADLVRVEGIGERTADLLLGEVERSKTAELWRFIHGLGIPQVGEAKARLLAVRCGDLAALGRMNQSSLAEAVGVAAAASVAAFMHRPENRADLAALIAAGVRPLAPLVSTRDLRGLVFVFTGTLTGLTRAEATARAVAAGGIVRDSVSRRTDYVVAGEGAGAKLAEADRLGVRVITEVEFRRMVGMVGDQ